MAVCLLCMAGKGLLLPLPHLAQIPPRTSMKNLSFSSRAGSLVETKVNSAALAAYSIFLCCCNPEGMLGSDRQPVAGKHG